MNINTRTDKMNIVRSVMAIILVALVIAGSVITVAAAISETASQEEDAKSVFESINYDSFNDNLTVYEVTVSANGISNSYIMNKGTVANALELAQVEVGKNQVVYPSENEEISESTAITVYDAKKISITADGKTEDVLVPYGKLGESLGKAGFKLGKDDILSESKDAQVKDIEKLTVKRVTYKEKVSTETVSYERKNKNTDKLELGVTKLKTKGVNGKKEVTKRYKYIDGKEAGVKTVAEKTVKKPVDEVTLIGTKGANVSNVAGTFVDMYGNTVAYSNVHTGSGTAYTAPAGAYTATGVPAYHGGVAVNPNIIPYGSKLYVTSTDGSVVYGYCTAVDTGGALMDGSAIVDCFYNTYGECVSFGRRNVNVYVVG